jgi:hypothetical protein
MKKPKSDFEKYITDLENNWYSSKEELMKVSDNELFRIGLPGRLVTIIREKLGQGGQQQQTPQTQQQQPQKGYEQQSYNQPTGNQPTYGQPSSYT